MGRAVLIGSAAYQDDYQDIDLIADDEFLQKFKAKHGDPNQFRESLSGQHYVFKLSTIVEITVPSDKTAYQLVLLTDCADHKTIFGFQVGVASIAVLAALKKAHLILPHQWDKHIKSYKILKDLLGVKVFKPKEFNVQVIYRQHRKECKDKAKPHPKLNVVKNDFFEEAEFKVFDHDTIHQAVALGEVPAYTLMQDGEVWVSRSKWKTMSSEEQFACLQEEASVLALERSIIPALFLGKDFRGAKWAYHMALFKVCTTITSGWFRDYCIEHYHRAIESRPDFVEMFLTGLGNGMVKVLKPEVVFGEPK